MSVTEVIYLGGAMHGDVKTLPEAERHQDNYVQCRDPYGLRVMVHESVASDYKEFVSKMEEMLQRATMFGLHMKIGLWVLPPEQMIAHDELMN